MNCTLKVRHKTFGVQFFMKRTFLRGELHKPVLPLQQYLICYIVYVGFLLVKEISLLQFVGLSYKRRVFL